MNNIQGRISSKNIREEYQARLEQVRCNHQRIKDLMDIVLSEIQNYWESVQLQLIEGSDIAGGFFSIIYEYTQIKKSFKQQLVKLRGSIPNNKILVIDQELTDQSSNVKSPLPQVIQPEILSGSPAHCSVNSNGISDKVSLQLEQKGKAVVVSKKKPQRIRFQFHSLKSSYQPLSYELHTGDGMECVFCGRGSQETGKDSLGSLYILSQDPLLLSHAFCILPICNNTSNLVPVEGSYALKVVELARSQVAHILNFIEICGLCSKGGGTYRCSKQGRKCNIYYHFPCFFENPDAIFSNVKILCYCSNEHKPKVKKPANIPINVTDEVQAPSKDHEELVVKHFKMNPIKLDDLHFFQSCSSMNLIDSGIEENSKLLPLQTTNYFKEEHPPPIRFPCSQPIVEKIIMPALDFIPADSNLQHEKANNQDGQNEENDFFKYYGMKRINKRVIFDSEESQQRVNSNTNAKPWFEEKSSNMDVVNSFIKRMMDAENFD